MDTLSDRLSDRLTASTAGYRIRLRSKGNVPRTSRYDLTRAVQ